MRTKRHDVFEPRKSVVGPIEIKFARAWCLLCVSVFVSHKIRPSLSGWFSCLSMILMRVGAVDIFFVEEVVFRGRHSKKHFCWEPKGILLGTKNTSGRQTKNKSLSYETLHGSKKGNSFFWPVNYWLINGQLLAKNNLLTLLINK